LAGEALSFVQQTGDRIDIARLLLNVSLMAVTHLDLERAEAFGEEALVLFREEGDRWGEAYALIRLGRIAQEHGDLALASDFLEASLALLQDIGDPEGVAVVLGHLGWVKRAQGAQPAAARHFAGELALGRERHHPKSIADALLGEGALALDRGDVCTGGVAWDECLRIAVELEDRMIIAAALEWSSHLAASGTARTAAHVLGAASAMRDRFGFPPGARLVDEHKNIVRGLRSQLGEASFKSAFEEGRGLPPDEAIAEARVILDQAISDPTVVPLSALSNPSRAGLAGLSPREVEVLRLLVEGHSNAEIGDALFIGVRTVRAHVASILAKLDVPTRTAASSYAIRHDLV